MSHNDEYVLSSIVEVLHTFTITAFECLTILLIVKFSFQFSLIQKRENAHSEGIWACAWGKFVPGNENLTQNGTDENTAPVNAEDYPDRSVFASYYFYSFDQGRFLQSVIQGWFMQSFIICKFIASNVQKVK